MLELDQRRPLPTSDEYRQTASRLQQQLQAARGVLDRACAQCITLKRLQLDDEIADEVAQILDHARSVRQTAREAYLFILKHYTDFITRGILPRQWHDEQ